jgi:methylmalonyl-CoA mutase
MPKLLEEFPPVPTAEWEAAIRADLNGADYAQRLVWQSPEGIAVQPFYRREDLEGIANLDLPPDEFPYTRGTRPGNNWRIAEEIDASDRAEANRLAREAETGGAEEIVFLNARPRDAQTLGAGLRIPFRITGPAIDATQFRGATAVQQLAFSIAAGIDELARRLGRGASVDEAARSVEFRIGIGANFFFEIAKLRTLRMLWARVVESFGGSREAARAVVYARTSCWNKTVYDPYVNVLRATTEAMSAALGGCDSLAVAPHDEPYREPDRASLRLARNTQLMLKKEALLDRVADPAGGSYYVEVLTDSLAREAWRLMQRVEAAGGFAKASAFISAEIEKSKEADTADVASRRRVLVGTNEYPNPEERMLPSIGRLQPDRAAEAFETIRLRTERDALAAGHTPEILAAEFGDPKMRRARSVFVRNLFGCGGFRVVVRLFDTAEAIAAAGADAIVLCTSDDACLPLVTRLIPLLYGTPVIVAGPPNRVLELAGVDDFVHARSNVVEVLERWQERLGVRAER